jgi:hypothetical protein
LEETRAHTLEDALFRTRNVAKIDGNRWDNGVKTSASVSRGGLLDRKFLSSNPPYTTRGLLIRIIPKCLVKNRRRRSHAVNRRLRVGSPIKYSSMVIGGKLDALSLDAFRNDDS